MIQTVVTSFMNLHSPSSLSTGR